MPVLLGLGVAPADPIQLDLRTEDIRWGYDDGNSYNSTGTTFVYVPHESRGTWVSWRFPLAIPRGATIQSAHFTLYTHDNSQDWSNLGSDMDLATIQEDNAAQFSNGSDAVTRLANRGTAITWVPQGGGGIGLVTPAGTPVAPGTELAAIFQELVNRPNWQEGDHALLTSLTKGSGGNFIGCSGVGSVADRHPRLEVTYLP